VEKIRHSEEVRIKSALLAHRIFSFGAAVRRARADFVADARGSARSRRAIHHLKKNFGKLRSDARAALRRRSKPIESTRVIRPADGSRAPISLQIGTANASRDRFDVA